MAPSNPGQTLALPGFFVPIVDDAPLDAPATLVLGTLNLKPLYLLRKNGAGDEI